MNSPAHPSTSSEKIPGTLRRFYLHRAEDETGVSGTGDVAEGVCFTDGTCVLRWLTATTSTAVYRSTDDLITIHGHGGRTQIRWVDSIEEAPPRHCEFCGNPVTDEDKPLYYPSSPRWAHPACFQKVPTP